MGGRDPNALGISQSRVHEGNQALRVNCRSGRASGAWRTSGICETRVIKPAALAADVSNHSRKPTELSLYIKVPLLGARVHVIRRIVEAVSGPGRRGHN